MSHLSANTDLTNRVAISHMDEEIKSMWESQRKRVEDLRDEVEEASDTGSGNLRNLERKLQDEEKELEELTDSLRKIDRGYLTRQSLVELGSTNPELRPHIRPVLAVVERDKQASPIEDTAKAWHELQYAYANLTHELNQVVEDSQGRYLRRARTWASDVEQKAKEIQRHLSKM